MRKRNKWIAAGVGLWLTGAVCIGSGVFLDNPGSALTRVVQAATQSETTQGQIDAANKKREQLEKERTELKETLSSSESKKGNILQYISTLDKKMDTLTDKVKSNEAQIQLVQSDIDELLLQEAQATAKMSSQYETMKERIKYMYEDGTSGYLELLAGSSSLSEMYNHLEYISKISEYDQKMYGEYESTKQKLTKTKKNKQAKKDELVATKETLSFEKQSVKQLISKKKGQLTKYNNLIADSESSISTYDAKIAAQENQVESLLAKKRQEIAAEEAAQKSSPSGKGHNGTDTTTDQTTAGRISCGFGPRTAPTAGASTYHKGIDIATPTGTIVRAAKAGTVVTATYSASAGNFVAIYHGDGVYTYYMHNSSLRVSVGEKVTRGQTIALSGSTGISTGPHLHFAVYANGSYVNPLNYVSR